ncbi:zinc-ribbon domain-containing protein [Celeribacter neptunius]|uniref:MJ0042 family finger-like domain-containing protein n=1 Tax=Celeribacter neptunius TaxID=588602 RepID=A0A1I3ULN0_9RHOB|nr:zinc-ribbon domain-containing protein [Celeribacter neptunius]SFJ83960.1 MJ0042 family finger-like domain-containing protein [Celeribacter neptunius]
MRLICPNCGAQYEVDARVIPDAGRDVQCSNCGHTWFQQPAHLDNELAREQGYELSSADAAPDEAGSEAEAPPTPEADEDASPEPEVEPEPEVGPVSEAEPAPEAAPEPVIEKEAEPEPEPTSEPVAEPSPDFAPEAESEAEPMPEAESLPDLEPAPVEPEPAVAEAVASILEEQDTAEAPLPSDSDIAEEYEDEEPATVAPVTPKPASALKDSVRDILRAEVEFDHSMRQPESDTLETQPDLGLEEPAQDAAKKSLRDRMARLRGLDPADPGIAAGSVAAAAGKRRDLLPDIEEINSTLSASSERDDDGTVPDEDTRRARAERSGFRTGFTLLVLIAAMLIVLYVLAPVIAENVPSLAGTMEAYVILANGFRAWLDQIMSAASTRLTALLGQLNS